ncbi:glycosyltransferase [Microbacterium sp. NPDC056234]|uniref:glycosyltransferase n=1 Tax=Microbacterium sp. NPDC056234 TaxID=3345757 RepID=UPI0035D9E8E2
MSRRIVLLVHPGAEMFGSDRMLLESAIGIIETGARVIVALPGRGMLDVALRAAGAEVVVVPMLVLRKTLLTARGLPVLFRDMLRGLGAAWRLMGRLRPDVVYVSTIIIPQWPVIARLRGVQAVSHVHEAEASGSRLVNVMLYLPHLASHRVLVNSRFSLETLRTALPRLASRAVVVYNGVDSPTAPPPPPRQIDEPLRVLYIGRLSPRKGPDLVIEAASRLQDRGQVVEVTLLGAAFDGYEWYEAELRERADASGADVEFAGFHSDVWPFLARADVLVVPSRLDEPFGNTAVEGILALRPVIASDSSGLREAVDGYATAQLVPPGEADAIADALERVRADWATASSAAMSSRAEALRRHAPKIYRAAVAQHVRH